MHLIGESNRPEGSPEEWTSSWTSKWNFFIGMSDFSGSCGYVGRIFIKMLYFQLAELSQLSSVAAESDPN